MTNKKPCFICHVRAISVLTVTLYLAFFLSVSFINWDLTTLSPRGHRIALFISALIAFYHALKFEFAETKEGPK